MAYALTLKGAFLLEKVSKTAQSESKKKKKRKWFDFCWLFGYRVFLFIFLRIPIFLIQHEGGQAVKCHQMATSYVERSYKHGAEYMVYVSCFSLLCSFSFSVFHILSFEMFVYTYHMWRGNNFLIFVAIYYLLQKGDRYYKESPIFVKVRRFMKV